MRLREQLAVMPWQYSGSPVTADKELHFTDADEISSFGDGRLGPWGQATRTQAAQMLKNFIENQETNI